VDVARQPGEQRTQRSRGVLGELDRRLQQVERQLEGHRELLSERERLLTARAALTGEPATPQVSQDDVAGYLEEHPGARPGEIAKALGVSSGTISAHLFRGKHTRFVSRASGWHVRHERAPERR
jgi:hypothetical protein